MNSGNFPKLNFSELQISTLNKQNINMTYYFDADGGFFFFFLKTANKESKPEQVVYWEAFVKFRLATSSSKKTAKKKEKKK